MHNFPEHCERCGVQLVSSTMSRFNTDTICLTCAKRERAHPKYAEAAAAELAAVRSGNMNFPGIGCPADLYAGVTHEIYL